MEIAFIIVSGLVLMTIFASGFDYLSKRRKKLDNETKQKVLELETKVADLEKVIHDNNDTIAKLETDLSFFHNLLEKK